MNLQNPTAGQYVLDVHPNDVLFGRGSGPNDHEGNIRFRDLVAQRKTEYMATNHRQTKAKIAKQIVDQVFNVGGRFLKKLEANEAAKLGIDHGGRDVYEVVGDDTIMEKAKQALRQNRNREDSPKPPPSNARQLTPPPQRQQQQQSPFDHPGPVFQPPLQETHQQSFAFQQQQEIQQPAAAAASALYSLDNDGYATYTTTLDDPEDQHFFRANNHHINNNNTTFNRRNFMEMANSTGNSTRRGSLLGGRKPDPSVTGTSSTTMAGMATTTMQPGGYQMAGMTTTTTTTTAPNFNNMRRESLQLDEIWNRRQSIQSMGKAAESMQMSDLMESFRGMSTTGELNSSSDTIGTIDGMVPGSGMSVAHLSGMSNMSVMNMSSSDSFFKAAAAALSPDDLKSGSASGGSMSSGSTNPSLSNTTPPPPQQQQQPRALPTRDSLGGSTELWNSRHLHTLLREPMEHSISNFDSSSNNNFSFRTLNNNSTSKPSGGPRLSTSSEGTANNDSTIPQQLFDINHQQTANATSTTTTTSHPHQQEQQHPSTAASSSYGDPM